MRGLAPIADSLDAHPQVRTNPMKGPMESPSPVAVTRIDVDRHRRALLAAAAEELSRNPESSMADVAQAANLTRATLYRHFSNRQTLLEAIQTEALTRAGQTLTDCRLEEGNAFEALKRVVSALSKHGMCFRIILIRAPEHNAPFRTRREQILSPIIEVVRRGQAEGDIRTDLSPEWILTALKSLLMAAVRDAPATKQSDMDVAELIFRTLIDGISTADRAAPAKD